MMKYQTGPNYADNDEGMRRAKMEADCASHDNDCPAGIWARDGWLAVSAIAPDGEDEDARESEGWALVAVVEWSFA